jgi:hypothetical protein
VSRVSGSGRGLWRYLRGRFLGLLSLEFVTLHVGSNFWVLTPGASLLFGLGASRRVSTSLGLTDPFACDLGQSGLDGT